MDQEKVILMHRVKKEYTHHLFNVFLMFPQSSTYSLTSFSCPLHLFWDGSGTVASHCVCLFIDRAIPALIQMNVCLHNTQWKVNVFLHVYFPELVHQIAFLHPLFATSPHPAQVSRIRKALSGVLFKGSLPQPLNPHVLWCRYSGSEALRKKESKAGWEGHRKLE